jgi:mannose-6-phosphate isomerase-like protein (cupin superfamily)
VTGEAAVLGPGEGRKFWTSLSYGAVKVEPGNADFSVFREQPAAGRTRAAPHAHRSYDEAWFIIEGTVEFLLDGRHERQAAGAFIFVPRGVTHSFANPGPGPARILVIGSSPAQAMVEEIGRLAQENRMTKENIADLYQRFDSELR